MNSMGIGTKALLPRRGFMALAGASLLAAAVVALPGAASRADEDTANGEPAVPKIDVGGYKLTLSVRGRGSPSVVIEPGFGLAAVESEEWKAVCDEIAKTNAVVLYDRAGLGGSEPAPGGKPRTSRDAARDLHALLTHAEVPGPYVLVGHSIGGLHVRVFADQYPNDVAGVVLVDATHPDQEAKWLAALPRETKGEPEAVTKGRQFIRVRLAEKGDRNPEHLDVVQSRQQVRAAKPLGAKPLAVLTHAKGWKMDQSLPDDVSECLDRVTQELQAGTAKLSSDSTHTVAKKAGHGIHVDEPELVIAAIREVVGKVKTN